MKTMVPRFPALATTPPLPVVASPLVRDDVPLEALDAAAWDALGPGQPLLSHAFLGALHDTGCASRAAGWHPCYLTAWRGTEFAGAMPLYVKLHSFGEYVFDWGWADAYRRHGRRYYPKLVAAIPFTPVTGPRLLAADASTRRALLDAALARVADGTHSSLHVLFADTAQAAECAGVGMIARRGIQFHWTNPGYRDFADFLAAFTHDRRKKIRQDRRRLGEAGVTFVRKLGTAITAADWAFFYQCYSNTYAAHHSTPYLTLPFFERIGATLAPNLLMVLGMRRGQPVCAALDVYTSDTLWGRYWGATEYVPGMHFEACYYQAIEFCIEQRIGTFEGGAQGIHKLARGLTPVTTHSAHAIGDRDFALAIAEFCARERDDVAETVDELEAAAPYRKGLEP